MEWLEDNKFNAFNSWKGLLYANHYRSISHWQNSGITPLPPIEASLDPVHACNLKCDHCNASRYLSGSRMTDKHLIELVEFLGSWGVQAICFGGGGEPTIHRKLGDAILRTSQMKMESSVATNGTLFTDDLISIMADKCRWVGVSVDAAERKTYRLGKKKDCFDKVIGNISKLVKKAGKCEVAFKFLVFDYNKNEILDAAILARELGVRDFHARPADFRHQGMGEFKKKQNIYDAEFIKEQMEKCHALETKYFRVFTVTHKFNEDFTPKRKFSQCYASPICIQLCADMGVYLCPDTRHIKFYKLCDHDKPENILRVWGGKKHYDLVFKNGCGRCQSRCTFSPYNEMCERLFINQDDPMMRGFV